MTVASLWKALDRAGCGKAVGAEGLLDPRREQKATNPWNINDRPIPHHPTFAIDLSIWICESLSSSAMAENNTDPTLHLVFARTVKLLTIGVKIVGVIEGTRRLRVDGERDEFQRRRNGTRFWVACKRCEEMFGLLGVPVVRAIAEGEALCALLNQKGIVDGVISNDGDCLLFGAKVLYTKFSIENLNQGKVMRYDANDLVACLDDDDSDETNITARENPANPLDVVRLNRIELIVFATLTGSDVAGSGLPKVGCRKALRFIRKCQIDNPLRAETAAFDELLSWAKTTSASIGAMEGGISHNKCSLCSHAGTKSSHLKHGCENCGTSAGEPCFHLSPGGRFRKSLQAKARKMGRDFDPEMVAKVYQTPNDNQIPRALLGKTSRDVLMKTPDLQGFLNSSLIIRGRSYTESRGYILQALSRLIVRSELSNLCKHNSSLATHPPTKLPRSILNKPVLVKVVKAVTRSSIACFEVLWTIKAATKDSEGNPIDEFEFSTIEDMSVVKKCYPDHVCEFMSKERERLKQGAAEQERRKVFLESMTKQNSQVSGEGLLRAIHKADKVDKKFFARKENIRVFDAFNRVHSSVNDLKVSSFNGMGDDVAQLLQGATRKERIPRNLDDTQFNESIDTVSTISFASVPHDGSSKLANRMLSENSPYRFTLSPGHLYFLSTPPVKLSGKCEKTLKLQQDNEERVEGMETFAGYLGGRRIGLYDQESLTENMPFLPPSSSPGLVPDLKRSRFTCTPPFAERSLCIYGDMLAGNEMSYREEYLQSSFQGSQIPKQLWRGQAEPLLGKDSLLVAHFECLPVPADTSSISPAVYQHKHHQKYKGFSLRLDEEVTDNTANIMAVDQGFLSDSFVVESIHSPHQGFTVDSRHPLSSAQWHDLEGSFKHRDPLEKSASHRRRPAFFPGSYSPEIHEDYSEVDPRRNLDVVGYDIVETAMAKWENKSRLAKMEEESRQLIEGNQGQYDFRNLFGET